MPEILRDTLSPDGHTAIRQNEAGEYEFCDTHSKRSLGRVDDAEDVSNVAFVVSWNPDGSKVALLMHYGTKLSRLLLFQKSWTGKFVKISFNAPHPIELYSKKPRAQPFPENGSGYSANAVGPWVKKDIVRLIAGECKEDYGYLFLSFEARVARGGVVIQNAVLHKVMSEDEAGEFLKQLGVRQ